MRISGLDFVRGIAVILVIFRHGTFECFLQRIGWAGVDLFFALSGYLIATLVLREFNDTGSFASWRFFIRRGFKIYPAFYIYLVIALTVNAWEHQLFYEPAKILSEVFFLQSYLPHIWSHTWSLAVEEQFYLIITITTIAIKFWKPQKVGRNILAITFLLLLVLVMRFVICYPHRFEEKFYFFSTHLRVDGIIVGVLVAYLVRFTKISNYVMKFLPLWFIGAGVLLIPLFFTEAGGFVMNTYGLTCLNLACGIFVLIGSQWVLKKESSFFISGPVRLMSFIGIHSYSIYLWHLMVLQELYRFKLDSLTYFAVYLTGAILVGALASYCFEYPFLKLRDRFFPAYNAQNFKA